jgi:GH15 family glucan-1,4-alpha-glucosidase
MPRDRIEDYGLIGDCETAALVGNDGSIDWLCWPRFDSDACFAALLGDDANGHWRIAPREPITRVRRGYRGSTLILETTLECATGTVKLIDFMPPRGKCSDVVRVVHGLRGRVAMCMELVLRFGYGALVPWVTRLPDGALRAIAGPDMVVLRTPVATRGEGMKTVADFEVRAGASIPFVLSYGPSHEEPPRPIKASAALRDTGNFWKRWIASLRVHGRYRQAIERSLVTLKALTYLPTGGIVAAPTTSLPEQLGGTRNWDYRYCWVRDATLSLLALMNAGFYEEARAWRDWLLRAAAGNAEQMQIMYGIAGERRLTEWEVPWLPGFRASKPIRIGNAAYGQLQLDIYGELMDALHHARRGGLPGSESGWALQRALLRRLAQIWREPDEGIWEIRGPRQQFTYSKVMAWVAFDRAVKSAEEFGLEGPLDEWRRLRDEIHRDVCEKAFDRSRNTFVQAYGSAQLDASLLLLPQLGFLPAHDPRVLGTLAAIERGLLRDGFVARYDTRSTVDGLPPGEGTFLACTFWLADAYVLAGRMEEARGVFERLLTIRNDLGLLAEEYDVHAQCQVGNFPQAFSHVALVNTALNLQQIKPPAEQRSDKARPGRSKPGKSGAGKVAPSRAGKTKAGKAKPVKLKPVRPKPAKPKHVDSRRLHSPSSMH